MFTLALFAALSLGPTSTARAAKDPEVSWTVTVDPVAARRGEHVALSLEAAIPEGWHLYSFTPIQDGPRPLMVPIDDPAWAASTPWMAPEPHREIDPNFNKEVEYYEGTVTFARGFQVTDAAVWATPR